jgi:hypothetical protein
MKNSTRSVIGTAVVLATVSTATCETRSLGVGNVNVSTGSCEMRTSPIG